MRFYLLRLMIAAALVVANVYTVSAQSCYTCSTCVAGGIHYTCCPIAESGPRWDSCDVEESNGPCHLGTSC